MTTTTTTILTIAKRGMFFADASSLRIDERQDRNGCPYRVVSVAGAWQRDGLTAWESWPAEQVLIPNDREEGS